MVVDAMKPEKSELEGRISKFYRTWITFAVFLAILFFDMVDLLMKRRDDAKGIVDRAWGRT